MKQETKSSAVDQITGVAEKAINATATGLADSSACHNQTPHKQDAEASSFLRDTPRAILEQLIFTCTKPDEIVFNPFAGTGVTVDACKKMSRRFYCSDLHVLPGREQDIMPWDITKGLPSDLPDPDLVILDPPYPRRPRAEFSKLEGDIGNMSIEHFNQAMRNLIGLLIQRNVKTIAFVHPPVLNFASLILLDARCDFSLLLEEKYEPVWRRFLSSYPKEYQAQMSEKANDWNVCADIMRDVEVWRRPTPEAGYQKETPSSRA